MSVKTWAAVAMTTVMTLQSPLPAAESVVTVRLGEQDTCRLTGVTTVSNQDRTIRFDLSKLNKAKKVSQAHLRLWVDLNPRTAYGRAFSVNRWNDADFDGFKVRAVGNEDKPLAVVYPFVRTYFALHEWDVTPAVRSWLADPGDNKGLKTNFPLPANDSKPAWRRPYLQVTCEGENPDRPGQPTELRAFYRSGQVFLTWKQIPHEGAFFDSTYRVYTHDQPITAANLEKAACVGETHRLSQLNYRRSAYLRGGVGSYGPYNQMRAFVKVPTERGMTAAEKRAAFYADLPNRENFVIDDTWASQIEGGAWLKDYTVLGKENRILEGPQLSDDAGLYVYTCLRPGKAYFAVTSVLEGNENREDFATAAGEGAGNSLGRPVEMKVERPRPVLQVAFSFPGRGGYAGNCQIREYTYWGGGDELHVEPSTPFYFRLSLRPELLTPGSKASPMITIEPWMGGFMNSTIKVDSAVYLPPTRLAPFPCKQACFANWDGMWDYYYGSRRKARTPSAQGWSWVQNGYGYSDRFNTGKDFRRGTIMPYIENHFLRELEYFFQEFPHTSRDKVFLDGYGSVLTLAVHHAEAFGSARSGQEGPWSAPDHDHLWTLMGKREWGLKTPEGFSVWDWNDLIWYSRKFPRKAWPFLSTNQATIAPENRFWKQAGLPEFYYDLLTEKRGCALWWFHGDHGAWVPTAPRVPLNQAYPAFTNVNFGERPQADRLAEPNGTPNGYLRWHHPEGPFAVKGKPALPLDLVDQPERFEIAINIGKRSALATHPTAARFGKTDVTLWRLQRFKVQTGRQYLWTNRKVATGQLLQVGLVSPGDRGLLTVPGFCVDRSPEGNKLILEPAEGKALPKIDENAKVGELSYAEYVRQCANPMLAPEIRPPATTIKLSQFTLPLATNRLDPDGSSTFAVGGFSHWWDTRLNVLEGGRYVISVRAKSHGVPLPPLLFVRVGDVQAPPLATRAVETTGCAAYNWYARLKAGRQFFRVGTPSEYYFHHQNPRGKNRHLTLADVTFTRVPDGQAEKTPVEIRLSPTNITVPAGLPVQMSAQVLNALGKPMKADIQWTCKDARIDANGVLSLDKPGSCTVSAAGAGLAAATTITAGEKFFEGFDEGNGFVRPAWIIADIAGGPASWRPPPRGHFNLTSLEVKPPASSRSVLLWGPGSAMSDYAAQADVFLPARLRTPETLVHGLVIRAKNKDNFYGLQIQRKGQQATVRLIRRQGGQESVLATADRPPALAPFDYLVNPDCPNWHKLIKKEAQNKGLDKWRMDRLRVQVRGNTLKAWLNGKPVFPEGVQDGALEEGTIGLYAEYHTFFDNVEILKVE